MSPNVLGFADTIGGGGGGFGAAGRVRFVLAIEGFVPLLPEVGLNSPIDLPELPFETPPITAVSTLLIR